MSKFNNGTDPSRPQEDPGLKIFVEGSGFARGASKQVIGDEFKFILNNYPEICKFAVTDSEVRTVKLRIYKVFKQVQSQPQNLNNYYNQNIPPQLSWKEVDIINEIFEAESDSLD